MSRPRTSILLPVFDAEATLDSCLRSILRQTDRDWECLVLDDGSVDGSLAAAQRIAETEPRIRILPGEHAGLVGTLNRGIEHCRGRFIARMDADDWMHRERLARQVEALEATPSLAAVGCHVRLFPRSALGTGMREYESWLGSIDSPERVRREAFIECPVAHPTLVARCEVLSELRYRDRGWPEDYDLILRLLASGREIGIVPRRLLGWRHTPSRLSRTDPAYGVDRFTDCKAWFLARGYLAEHDEYLLWGYGGTGRALQRALRIEGKRPAAIIELHPGRIGNTIQGAPVVAVEALPDLPRLPMVVSVAGIKARNTIRAELTRRGRHEVHDYICAA